MSILSTDTTVLTSDLSLVHSTESFDTTSTSTGNVFVGAPDDPFGNLVNALWSLPPEVGNVLLEDPPEGVPEDVFLDDVGDEEDEEDEDDDDDESFDLLAESQPKKKKLFRTLRSWTYDYKLRAVVDTFYILKDELAGQRKYNIAVIFFGVNRPSGKVWREIQQAVGYPDDLAYMVQAKGWMDEEVMLQWIRVVWSPFVQSVGGPTTPTYLLMDTFSSHRTEKVRHELALLGTIVDFVPPHCTSKLQVCDVSVNASLSSAIRGQYALFTMQHPDAPIERSRIAHWISHAKGNITTDTIVNGFKKIGIYYPLPTV
jgi:DDE superfamily endonuclease